MKRFAFLFFIILFFFFPSPIWAVSASSGITQYTIDTLNIITIVASGAAAFFLVKGGYHYLTSAGNPEAITQAKKTIKNALIGLVIVLGASLIVSLFRGALNPSVSTGSAPAVSLSPIETIEPEGGLTQVLIDAVTGFLKNMVQSAVKPIVDGIIGYLTTTPTLLDNQVIVNFWLVILGITDSLFVLVVALLGLRFMSASTFGYEEAELSKLLPKIGLAFLGANISLFLADYVILTANVMVKTVLDSTGGLNEAWVVDAVNPVTLITGTTPLIMLVFLLLFLIVAIVLLFMYIGRLIMISLFAVLSPLVFLLLIVPKFSDFAEIAIKGYVVTVFMVFVHVVIIQLASAFLVLPSTSGNSLISIAVAIGLFLTLLKMPSLMLQMLFYNSAGRFMRKIGHQIVNVISTNNNSSASRGSAKNGAVKTPRKAVAA